MENKNSLMFEGNKSHHLDYNCTQIDKKYLSDFVEQK